MSSVGKSWSIPALQPSLWRTARVLSSPLRLKVLRHLLERGPLTVSVVAVDLGLALSAASQSLRALNARGLLQATRRGRWVTYEAAPDPAVLHAGRLLRALRSTLLASEDGAARAYRVATAFTHPRRCAMLGLLQQEPMTPGQLQHRLKISSPAIQRHLRKLRRRDLVTQAERQYRILPTQNPLTQAFLAANAPSRTVAQK